MGRDEGIEKKGNLETKLEPTDADVGHASALRAMEDRSRGRGRETWRKRIEAKRCNRMGTPRPVPMQVCSGTRPRCVGNGVQPGQGKKEDRPVENSVQSCAFHIQFV